MKPDKELMLFNVVVSRLNFSWTRTYRWKIYGARHQRCSTCGAPPNVACRNMSDVKNPNKGFDKARGKVHPHDERVDWVRVYDGMLFRQLITRAQRDDLVRMLTEN